MGDILVVFSIDFVWMLFFLKVGGLVMEIGGYFLYGVIVVWEFGILVVVNLFGIWV